MKRVEEINIEEFDYDLPPEKIALYPLENRDGSRLLIYRDGKITESAFRSIGSFLTQNATLVLNDTRVVNARIVFEKSTGSKIEIFCLEPVDAQAGFHNVFAETNTSRWKCLIGGASKWKDGPLVLTLPYSGTSLTVTATLIEKREGYFLVTFTWSPPSLTFSEVLQHTGSVPLPPYIKRKDEKSDTYRYQTIFAKNEGSVAAPTAALHFSEKLLKDLALAGIQQERITLHVGAGTFKPVSSDRLGDHQMHAEWIDITYEAILNLAEKDFIVPVGTTSLRALESLYWIGVKIMRGDYNLHVGQWEVYLEKNINCKVPMRDSFTALAQWMKQVAMPRLFTQTSILVAPGYKMRVAKALITNFHQPKSTLLLLVAAGIGKDWKSVYAYALENDFRFLSYGDSNLLFFPQG